MEETMGTGEAANLPEVTVKILQRWEREGRLAPAAPIASNRRLDTETQLHSALESDHATGAPDQD